MSQRRAAEVGNPGGMYGLHHNADVVKHGRDRQNGRCYLVSDVSVCRVGVNRTLVRFHEGKETFV